MNNPMIYTDPDGELAWFVVPAIIAVVSGTSNLIANWDNVDGFWQGFTTFTVGAVLGFPSLQQEVPELVFGGGCGSCRRRRGYCRSEQ